MVTATFRNVCAAWASHHYRFPAFGRARSRHVNAGNVCKGWTQERADVYQATATCRQVDDFVWWSRLHIRP
jgi:hypothetical protein